MTKESSPQTAEKRERPVSFRHVLISSRIVEKPFWHERQLTVEDILSKDRRRIKLE